MLYDVVRRPPLVGQATELGDTRVRSTVRRSSGGDSFIEESYPLDFSSITSTLALL